MIPRASRRVSEVQIQFAPAATPVFAPLSRAPSEIPVRDATGFYLANAGQDTRAIQLYFGHKNIQQTPRYTGVVAAQVACLNMCG